MKAVAKSRPSPGVEDRAEQSLGEPAMVGRAVGLVQPGMHIVGRDMRLDVEVVGLQHARDGVQRGVEVGGGQRVAQRLDRLDMVAVRGVGVRARVGHAQRVEIGPAGVLLGGGEQVVVGHGCLFRWCSQYHSAGVASWLCLTVAIRPAISASFSASLSRAAGCINW